MELTTKPDFARVREMWRHFWNRELMERPPVVASIRREGASVYPPGPQRYEAAVTGRWDDLLEAYDRWIETTEFLAETVPFAGPDFGPDQFAAFLGGELKFSKESPGTNWIVPWVEEWDEALPITLSHDNPAWQGVKGLSRRLAEHGRGRYLVGVCDLHSNMDALLAMRGAQALSMDFYDAPEALERAMHDVRRLYAPVYEGLYEAGGMSPETGTIGWIPFWCPGRMATIQCDYVCMISPPMSRKYVIPALEEEAAFLDHCVYHLDGPGALPHLDDILAIRDIDAIQWVSGAGNARMHTWHDVLKKCQAAGKSLHIYDVGPEEVKALHPLLEPNKVAYQVRVGSRRECDDLLDWLKRHS